MKKLIQIGINLNALLAQLQAKKNKHVSSMFPLSKNFVH